jgi:hypothetical protein
MRTLSEEASGNAQDFVHRVEISQFQLALRFKGYLKGYRTISDKAI